MQLTGVSCRPALSPRSVVAPITQRPSVFLRQASPMFQVISSKSARNTQHTLSPERGTGKTQGLVWKDTVILTQDGRFLMALAIGPDGRVWSYRESHPCDDRPAMRCTNLYADTIAVGFDNVGRAVVFAAKGLELDFSVCTNVERMRWSDPYAANLPAVSQATSIEQVYADNDQGELQVGVMFRLRNPDGAEIFNASYSNWGIDGPEFRQTPVYLTSLHEMSVTELMATAAASSYQ